MKLLIGIIGFGLFLVSSFFLIATDVLDNTESTAMAQKIVWQPKEGKELIGQKASEWEGIEWLQEGPLSLSDLKGKVVLLRFWLVDCPYCTRSAPALKELWDRYKDQGLVVVGLHHPKSPRSHKHDVILEAARILKFDFPIGHDAQWKTIRAYGVGKNFKNFTSVSFLIDRNGIIRFVHDGGEFHDGGGKGHEDCNAAFVALDKQIKALLLKE